MTAQELRHIIHQGESIKLEFKASFNRGVIETLGAYLLFNNDYCYNSDLQVGRFKSATTIIDSISLNTDLFSEVDQAMAFIKKHLMVEYIITGDARRTERYDYPIEAIRELLINMIVHRDYSQSSAAIVKIFDDRVEFNNPGKLYGGIRIEELLLGTYTSKTRNKLIATLFKEAGLIERYGTCIMRVLSICDDYGVIAPKFEEVANGFRVILYKEKLTTIKTAPKAAPRAAPKTAPKTKTLIVQEIKRNPKVSISELMLILGKANGTIKEHIAQLKKEKIIEHIGPNNGGYWQIIEERAKKGEEKRLKRQ